MEILKHAHSGLRWVVLILLLTAIAQAFSGMSGNKPFNRKFALFSLISCHIQLVIGLTLYFIGSYYSKLPDTVTDETMISVNRFFRMEHIAMMVIAIALITVGNSRAKKAATDKAKHKSIAVFFTIGLLLILASIPWPFMAKFAGFGWF